MTRPALKNQALRSWIKTFPIDRNLDEFLFTLPVEIRTEVESSARAACDCASRLLDAAAEAGPVDMSEFGESLEQRLRTKFEWIDADGVAVLHSYTGWFAWHEGYAAS
jgi:hypothetical protein